MPNLDPRAMKKMMESMGMRSKEIEASKVTIEGKDSYIVISNPQVVAIDFQGSMIFQITGTPSEKPKAKAEISAEDVALVMQQSGISDEGMARHALEESNGDIAAAIISLKKEKE